VQSVQVLPTLWGIIFQPLKQFWHHATDLFHFRYINQPGDNATLTLTFPQPLHLNAWTMTIMTDIDIQGFNPISTNSLVDKNQF